MVYGVPATKAWFIQVTGNTTRQSWGGVKASTWGEIVVTHDTPADATKSAVLKTRNKLDHCYVFAEQPTTGSFALVDDAKEAFEKLVNFRERSKKRKRDDDNDNNDDDDDIDETDENKFYDEDESDTMYEEPDVGSKSMHGELVDVYNDIKELEFTFENKDEIKVGPKVQAFLDKKYGKGKYTYTAYVGLTVQNAHTNRSNKSLRGKLRPATRKNSPTAEEKGQATEVYLARLSITIPHPGTKDRDNILTNSEYVKNISESELSRTLGECETILQRSMEGQIGIDRMESVTNGGGLGERKDTHPMADWKLYVIIIVGRSKRLITKERGDAKYGRAAGERAPRTKPRSDKGKKHAPRLGNTKPRSDKGKKRGPRLGNTKTRSDKGKKRGKSGPNVNRSKKHKINDIVCDSCKRERNECGIAIQKSKRYEANGQKLCQKCWRNSKGGGVKYKKKESSKL